MWHKAKCYFTCSNDASYLIMVPDMKNIHPYIMEECAMTDRWVDRWTIQ